MLKSIARLLFDRGPPKTNPNGADMRLWLELTLGEKFPTAEEIDQEMRPIIDAMNRAANRAALRSDPSQKPSP
jgi:hypothetical protein